MSLRLFLVDDEISAIRRLTKALSAIEGIDIIGTASDGEEALERIKVLQPEVVFVDIEMPKLNGIKLARSLRRSSSAEIVFVTALSEWAAEAFEIHAVDYILKPVQADRIAEAIGRVRRRMAEPKPPVSSNTSSSAHDYESNVFWVPKGKGKVRVPIEDIVRVEASKDYALIYTSNNTFIIRSTMKDLSKRFEGSSLMRVHRSTFLNLGTASKAEYIGRRISRLHTEDGAIVEISSRYAEIVQSQLLGLASTAKSSKT